MKRGAAPLGPGLYPISTTTAKAEADGYPEEEDSFGTNYGLCHILFGITPWGWTDI